MFVDVSIFNVSIFVFTLTTLLLRAIEDNWKFEISSVCWLNYWPQTDVDHRTPIRIVGCVISTRHNSPIAVLHHKLLKPISRCLLSADVSNNLPGENSQAIKSANAETKRWNISSSDVQLFSEEESRIGEAKKRLG